MCIAQKIYSRWENGLVGIPKIHFLYNYYFFMGEFIMDDGLLLYNDKKYLAFCLNEIDKFLENNLNLKLNLKKLKLVK